MNKKTSLVKQEAFITVSSELKIVAYNETAEEFFIDFSNSKLQHGTEFIECLPSSLAEVFHDQLRVCKKGKFQSLLVDKDKTASKLKFNFCPILEIDGSIDKIAISIDEKSDLDSQNTHLNELSSEDELDYNKQVYSNLFYNNPDPVFSLDFDGNFVKVNAAGAKLAETTIDELLNMNFLPLVAECDQEMVLHRFSENLKGITQSYQTKFVSLKKNEKILEINSFPIFYNKKIIGVYGIAKDITLQKRAEDKITEERQMLRAIIDNIPDYIFVKNREHKSILANKKFYSQILGHSSDQSNLGYSPYDYFEAEKAKVIVEDNERVMRTGEAVINRPDVVMSVDGKQEMVLLTKVPLKNQIDETIGLVGIARDFTQTYLYNKKQDLIFKIIKAFGDRPTFSEAMIQTLKSFCEDLGFDYAEAFKVGLDNKKLVRIAFYPLEKDLSENGKYDYNYSKGEGLPGMVWDTGEVKIVREDDGTGILKNMTLENNIKLKSAVGFPIFFQGNLISIICLGSIENTKKIEVDALDDITFQIASAIEGKRSQDQLNDFFQFSPNLIAVIGVDGFIKKINPSFIEKFGFSECEILTKPFTEFIHPEDLDKTYQAIKDISIDGPDFELRCLKKDGEYLWISWRFSQYFSEENVVFIYGTDITPLKKVHEELSENIATRKKIQKKLKDSEQKYKSLFDSSPIPMWVLDRKDLRFLKVNSAATELYGYSAEEFSNMTVRDLWASGTERHIKKVPYKTDEFFRVKVEHVKKNGEKIFVIIHSNPMIYSGEKARISLVRNVTARIKAEERLLLSEKRFKALVQEGSDIISIVDKNFNYVYNSPAARAIFGLKPSEIKGTNFEDYIHKKDYEKISNELRTLQNKKRIQLPLYRIKNSNNNWSWVETIITNLTEDPAIKGIVMNSRDITQFVTQERKLMESLRRYDTVAKATSDLITDYDIQKNEMKVSNVAAELFGYTSENRTYSGEWWNSKIHPDDYENVKFLANKMLDERITNLTTEYRFECADGSYKYILDRSYLILDENNNPKRVIGSMQDITERKQHLIAIENHNKRLREIAWTQSHVVRAPLAKVMGLVDLLMNYKNDINNIDEILDNILTSANELDSIIRKIAVQTEKEL